MRYSVNKIYDYVHTLVWKNNICLQYYVGPHAVHILFFTCVTEAKMK